MIALDKVHDLTTQRNMETLRRLVLDTGGRTADIRWGQATITWPGGSVNSNAATVAHGLASAPVFMTVQASNGGPPGRRRSWCRMSEHRPRRTRPRRRRSSRQGRS